MPPLPEEPRVEPLVESANKGDSIVISGMSGLYPEADYVKDLADILYNKKNPINSEKPRWEYENPELPKQLGKISGLADFDAQFFKVYYRLGNSMDPMSRKLLEQTYQAIFDAGISPEHLSGRKVGVYIACCFSETEKASLYVANVSTGLTITGCSKSMYANRISYWINSKGPSMSIDASCSSSAVALELAYNAIQRGDCESAIVGGANLCLHPQSSIHYGRIIKLNMDGKTKSFAKNADGCSRAEAIGVILLQKESDAKRAYATITHVKTHYDPLFDTNKKQMYGLNRDENKVTKFFRDFYNEARISPKLIPYVEGYGSANNKADKMELQAISNVFCEGRSDPLYVGSVMSNVGYSEAVSAITSVTKVLLGFHTGKLAANLHYDEPRDDVVAIRDGRMKILSEHLPFNQASYVAINNFSVTGINGHVLLKGFNKLKNPTRYSFNFPYLVNISGRQESAVKKIFEDLKSRPIDPEEIALLHNIHENNTSGHLGRGFIILNTDEEKKTVSLVEKSDYCDSAHRPLWFVYSGMGSQWAGMGNQLMRIPMFSAAIDRCRKALEPKGIDIVDIITSTDNTMFDNILHSFVGIAAIQIGLTDVLREMGIVPDKIIGHSVGELGCAYADGCFTAEEMILSAYSRGLVSVQTPFVKGSMAAVGLGYQQIKSMLPPELEVACHNSSESSTISGPADIMKEFVAKLTAQKIFAREVPCSNIAYHSKYIKEAGPSLLKYLSEVITDPKPRSERWVSTSVPQEKWDQQSAMFSSAEYHTNNLLSPVLFEETARCIPSNAVLIEIAPHGLLQAILKRSHPACVNIPLTRRGHADNAVFMLEGIGQLYMQGYNPKVKAIYPRVEFPVSAGTPMLSHLVEWAHHEKWVLPLYVAARKKTAAEADHVVSIHDEDKEYFKGHVIKNEMQYPFTDALIVVWDIYAMTLEVPRKSVSVVFNDINIYPQPALHKDKLMYLHVQIQKGNGYFEVVNEGTIIVSGYIVPLYKNQNLPDVPKKPETYNVTLKSHDVYRKLFDLGYGYRGKFRSIKSMNESMTTAQISWEENWVTFLDSIIQLNIMKSKSDKFLKPSWIRKLKIDVNAHAQVIESSEDMVALEAVIDDEHDITYVGGVTVTNIEFEELSVSSQSSVSLKVLELMPNFQLNDIEDICGSDYFLPVKDMNMEVQAVSLRSRQLGDMDSLYWEEVSEPKHGEIAVNVHYAGLNVKDARKASGSLFYKLNDDIVQGYGMDYSGVTKNGTRVMGLIKGNAASSVISAEPNLLWPVPAHWSLEDAATVPLPYAHAFYCLAIKTVLVSGTRILVHGATGGLGQAVISIALAHGCEVFATVSDVKKKRFLRKLFPKIPEERIGNSRDSSFRDMVMLETNGKGFDIAISCVKGYLKDCTHEVCARSGIVIDTHQLASKDKYNYGMFNLTKERACALIDFSSIFKEMNRDELEQIQIMMSDGIARGYVRPLSRVTYKWQDASRAFRLLASSKHRGRALLQLNGTIPVTKPRLTPTSSSSHIVIDSTGDLTLSVNMVDTLVERGAKNIVLHTKVKDLDGFINLKITKWGNSGAHIKLLSDDLTKPNNISKMVSEIEKLGPIEGLFIVNTGIKKQTNNEIVDVLSITDKGFRSACPNLKYFSIINEASSIGQEICFNRVTDNLPATLIVLPSLNKYAKSEKSELDGGMANYDAISTIEKALKLNKAIILAQMQQTSSPQTLIEHVSCAAGISISENTEDSMTMAQLGVENDRLEKLAEYLYAYANLSIKDRDVPELTVGRLRDLQRETSSSTDNTDTGVGVFFGHVEPDELVSSMEMVPTSTLISHHDLYDLELDSSESYLCLVPGLDGIHIKFKHLAERLKLPSVVLQTGFDHLNESIQDTAGRLAKIMLGKLNMNDKKFHILGYSSGVLVSLEIASILEEHGLEGVVFCVDAEPDSFKDQMFSYLGKTGEELQNELINHIYTIMYGSSSDQLANELKNIRSLKGKIQACVRSLKGKVSHSMEYSELVINAAFKKIEQVQKYDAKKLREKPLKSQLIYIRTKSNNEESTLQKYSKKPVIVYDTNLNHANALKDFKCANIVNRHLDKTIVEKFYNRNMCNTYWLNASSFMRKADELLEIEA